MITRKEADALVGSWREIMSKDYKEILDQMTDTIDTMIEDAAKEGRTSCDFDFDFDYNLSRRVNDEHKQAEIYEDLKQALLSAVQAAGFQCYYTNDSWLNISWGS